MPMGIAISQVNANVEMEIIMVSPMRSRITSATGASIENERPKLPRSTMLPIHFR